MENLLVSTKAAQLAHYLALMKAGQSVDGYKWGLKKAKWWVVLKVSQSAREKGRRLA